MKLLKLVIVDDEPILLQGLLDTYSWADMGFKVVGSAQSGEQAIRVIEETRPHVVLTDIRMKQVSGLMVMEEIQKKDIDCLFVVLSAYRDFDYAQQACDLGAFAYLLKPIEDEKLKETMESAYRTCVEQMEQEARYESWENLLVKDGTSFQQIVVQKYVQGMLPQEKAEEVFRTLGDMPGNEERFITLCADIDVAYKITDFLDYEAARFALLKRLEEELEKQYAFWRTEGESGGAAFIIRTTDKEAVRKLKGLLEHIKKEEQSRVIAAISKPYKGLAGIKRSFEEAKKLFDLASMAGAGAFTSPEGVELPEPGQPEGTAGDAENLIVNVVRRNSDKELKDAFIRFVYGLPHEEEKQRQYLHRMMLRVEFMLQDSYGLTEDIREKFRGYYDNMGNVSAARLVDVCYRILGAAIEARRSDARQDETRYFREYMSEAVAYIEEHLGDEELTVVSVAAHIYLNPVYFGRVFKHTFQMTFKQYLLQRRMEKARKLLEEGAGSIGDICEAVGIHNPSYFSHLFKQYTGKLPSEYKKEYEGQTGSV